MLWFWRDLPFSARSAWQVKWLAASVFALVSVSALLSFSPNSLPDTVAEACVRAWYALISVVFGLLTFFCAPGLSRRPWAVMVPVAVCTGFLVFTDFIVAGILRLPTALALSDVMITRATGPYYAVWIWAVRVVVVVQIVCLIARMKMGIDGRDRNSALVLLCSLSSVYLVTAILTVEIQKPEPSFNAMPFVGLLLFLLAMGIFYTQRQFKMAVFYDKAKVLDQRRLQSIYAACESDVDNRELGHILASVLSGPHQTFLLRHGQGVPVGDIGKLAWCDELEDELNLITSRWPIVMPREIK